MKIEVKTTLQYGTRNEKIKGQRGWEHRLFQVAIITDRGQFTTDFKSGLACISDKRPKNTTRKVTKEDFKYVAHPTDETVLYHLASDAQCGRYTYNEFCSNLGYDNDSIKARDIYFKCQETLDELLKLGFTYEMIDNLVENDGVLK